MIELRVALKPTAQSMRQRAASLLSCAGVIFNATNFCRRYSRDGNVSTRIRADEFIREVWIANLVMALAAGAEPIEGDACAEPRHRRRRRDVV